MLSDSEIVNRRTLKMNSIFIRFLKNKNHLLNDIKNGFVLWEHGIKFNPSFYSILPSLISFWTNKNISSVTIQPILNKYNELGVEKFWLWFVKTMEEDANFNANLSYITTQIKSAKIKMKCFTELRNNQKMHPNHKMSFGDYGIALTNEWIEKNNGDRVIYVGSNSEITNRMGRLMSMLFSSVNGVDVIKAVFDVLAFTEVVDNSDEYEWRIVGNHNYAGKSYGDYPGIINFINDDIAGVYVKEEEDIEEFRKVLEEKKQREGSSSIPQISLSSKIFLTNADLQSIAKINTRR